MSSFQALELGLFPDLGKPSFPEDLYRQLTAREEPFRAAKQALQGNTTGEKEYWFPFNIPGDWNGVLVVGFHPSASELKRMEKNPAQFIGVMTGEAYTLLTAHIIQKLGISWNRSMQSNLIPWYVPPKHKVSIGEERFGFQFIDRLIRDWNPKLIIGFGADMVKHLVLDRPDATVTDLQGQLIHLPQYHTHLICATQPGNLIKKVEWIKSWENSMRYGLANWFQRAEKVKEEPPCYIIDNPDELRRHLQAIR